LRGFPFGPQLSRLAEANRPRAQLMVRSAGPIGSSSGPEDRVRQRRGRAEAEDGTADEEGDEPVRQRRSHIAEDAGEQAEPAEPAHAYPVPETGQRRNGECRADRQDRQAPTRFLWTQPVIPFQTGQQRHEREPLGIDSEYDHAADDRDGRIDVQPERPDAPVCSRLDGDNVDV